MRQTFGQFIDGMRLSEKDGGHLGVTFDSPGFGGSPELVGEAHGGSGAYQVRQEALVERGFMGAGEYRPEGYQRHFDEARWLIEGTMKGSWRHAGILKEALTSSDFPLYFGDVLDRTMLANYAETSYSWDMYCKRATLNDTTRIARIMRVDRGAAVLDGPIIPNSYGATGTGPKGLEQLSEYPLRRRVISGYTDQLYKFGCRMDYSAESLFADDLDALKDTPALFGRASRRTEEKRATQLYATSGGPNGTFFSTANKNLINPTVAPGCPYTNPPLSIDAVKWALTVLAMQRDLDGEPISIESAVLVYPPALKVDAENILGARELWVNMEGGNVIQNAALNAMTSGVRMVVANWAAKFAQGALNYYLPVVDTTYGNTAWYIFATPRNGRPALQLSFLRGREAPQIYMKLPNQVAIGEGRMGPGAGVMPGTTNTNPMEGDFETDSIDYKVRHYIGGTLLDSVCAVASNGSGV